MKNKGHNSSGKSSVRPRALVFSGYGLNCEEETKTAFEAAGGEAEIVHINDLIARPTTLRQFEIIVFPGGFSYGDDTGSGKAYGNRLKNHLGDALDSFFARDTLGLGVCNGFQIATSAGFLPGALMANDSARYLTRWVDVEPVGISPWLAGLSRFALPIAHGEGKYSAPDTTLDALEKEKRVAFRYVHGEMASYFGLPANPNGAARDIAGILGYGGRLLGMMPHPERAIRFTQLPHWTDIRETHLRRGEELPSEGPGLALFRNAVSYFT